MHRCARRARIDACATAGTPTRGAARGSTRTTTGIAARTTARSVSSSLANTRTNTLARTSTSTVTSTPTISHAHCGTLGIAHSTNRNATVSAGHTTVGTDAPTTARGVTSSRTSTLARTSIITETGNSARTRAATHADGGPRIPTGIATRSPVRGSVCDSAGTATRTAVGASALNPIPHSASQVP